MNKKYWKCPTEDSVTQFYIMTSHDPTDKHHSKAQTIEAHFSAAQQAFYCYSELREVRLIDAIHEVATLPPGCSKVAWACHHKADKHGVTVEATVYEIAASDEEDGIDPERLAALERAVSELYDVTYTLEGLVAEEDEEKTYPALPSSMRAAAGGEPSGKDRLRIEAAINLLYRAQRLLNHFE